MNAALRSRFERLLKDLPQWEKEDDRRSLLGQILRAHDVWDHLDLKGNSAVTASGLLDICEKDPTSLCVLLGGLRDCFKTDAVRRPEIDFLYTQHCGRGSNGRPRARWDGAPYPGLNFFDREHAAIFFGRDQALQDLVTALTKEQGQYFSVVLGASGAGKSSLVRAGLWAGLSEGRIKEMPGSRRWLITAMTPTELGDPMLALRACLHEGLKRDPFRSQCDWKSVLAPLKSASIRQLAEKVLEQSAAETRWLLILDQMEELFAAEMQAAGADFLDELIQATKPPSRLRVVATLRADFCHHCHSHPPLVRLMNRDGGTFHLGLPDRRSLEAMVRGPLTQVELVDENGKPERDWYLDPDLPATIASDADRHPGGLALMAFALRELYEKCKEPRRMETAAYMSDEFGGLGGAISRKADATLRGLGGSQADKALERVFARLVRVAGDGEATRRREPLAAWAQDAEARQVIDAFQKARLLVSDREPGGTPVVEVAHEALLREWPKLREWINDRKDGFQLAERVRAEARGFNQTEIRAGLKRPWDAEHIDRARRKLKAAGLLAPLEEDAATKLFLTPEVDWILEEIKLEETTNLRRLDIGRRLAELGDPRPGVGLREGLPDILWRDVSGGSVEIEKHGTFEVQPFRMAAYPITATQFRCFLEAEDGFGSGDWWRGVQRSAPDDAWAALIGNHPVTDVSWFDAVAFCRWLTAKLGLPVRLPDEQEWQWAAGNGRKWAYPWGPQWANGRANTSESDINRTTAVGMFPLGDTASQISDLAGNVWEWCRSKYDHPKNVEPGGDGARKLRGGSWNYSRGIARSEYRFNDPPDLRDYNCGFRVVVSSPIQKR